MRRWLIGLLACFCFLPLTVPCAAKEMVEPLTDAAQVVRVLHASQAASGHGADVQMQRGQAGRFVVTDAKPDETFGAKRVYTRTCATRCWNMPTRRQRQRRCGRSGRRTQTCSRYRTGC